MDIWDTTRKITLCVGLLVGALFFLYPHWRGSFEMGTLTYEYDLGRSFITAPPIPDPTQIRRLIGMEFKHSDGSDMEPYQLVYVTKATYRIHHVRQLTEVALALAFTFGMVRALRKPKGSD